MYKFAFVFFVKVIFFYIQLNFCNCLCGFCNLHMNTKYNKDIVIADALLEKITTIAEEYSRNHK